MGEELFGDQEWEGLFGSAEEMEEEKEEEAGALAVATEVVKEVATEAAQTTTAKADEDVETSEAGEVDSSLPLVPAPINLFENLHVQTTRNIVIWDIETGPKPWEELEQFFEAPVCPEFDEKAVKYGNAKKPETRAPILEAARQDHAKLVAGWDGVVEEARQKLLSDAALSAKTGRILAIGYCQGGDVFVTDHVGQMSEREMLARFWGFYLYLKRRNASLVGLNSNRFDIGFVVQRSWALGVEVPAHKKGRYLNPEFVDLSQEWNFADYGKMISLKDLAIALNTKARKSGSGKHFYQLFETDLEAALAYLRNDLVVPWECAVKMGVR